MRTTHWEQHTPCYAGKDRQPFGIWRREAHGKESVVQYYLSSDDMAFFVTENFISEIRKKDGFYSDFSDFADKLALIGIKELEDAMRIGDNWRD